MTSEFNFDEVIDRRGANTRKWDVMEENYGVSPDGGIPMWVADMEFRPPPAVIHAVERALDVGIFGYFGDRESYHEAIIGWMHRRHGWRVEPDWIATTHGIVVAMNTAIKAFCNPGDGVILQPPVYYPFSWAVERNGAQIVANPLVTRPDGRYEMDLDQLASVIDERTKLLLLCSPHNPGGRVWTRAELEPLAELCLSKGIIIVSDEVHHDLVYEGHEHTVVANLSDEVAARTVTFSGASKTFNLAGFMTGNVIASDPDLRRTFVRAQEAQGIFGPNLLGVHASRAAYNSGDAWLDEALTYLQGNRDLIADTLSARLPGVRWTPLDGTYLAWLDCSGLELPMPEVIRRVEENARLALSHGEQFGAEGRNFLRMNYALSRGKLQEALDRLVEALSAT